MVFKGLPLDESSEPDQEFIQGCAELNNEVRELHKMARDGLLNFDIAERQINSYLAVAALQNRQGGGTLPNHTLRSLVMSLPDSPHFSLLPDIGYWIRRVLTKTSMQDTLSVFVEQCIPCFRMGARQIPWDDTVVVMIQLANALLLGLYPDIVR
jgi:hypothetical protein